MGINDIVNKPRGGGGEFDCDITTISFGSIRNYVTYELRLAKASYDFAKASYDFAKASYDFAKASYDFAKAS